ncbi:hypothetical protein BCF44_115127 [Kutzneria buriramensis]|uniref:Uncharacterized protein n=1 Tax=Kutzneria buriramensis TaxID=1045776 RepID=A0A3E0H244_9PSEU|nr:hypothetical protein BCF44_115127 [Kutzneria buriramensis]
MTRRAQPVSAGQCQLLLDLFRRELADAASAEDLDDSVDDPGQSEGG